MEYIYVPVQFKGAFVRKMMINDQQIIGHRRQAIAHRLIIDEYAQQGYRYAGYIPTKLNGYGGVMAFDLIFEKDDE